MQFQGECNARNLQVLPATTMIFLPMALLSGIMGMNIEDLSGNKESLWIRMVLYLLLLKSKKII
ncbi:CorA family divalent cation transporter [Polynucleobacter corsicus]|uniref:CorA family divalent cation transporter n=1 Tax=Polynucleobacter corsicus TaxID=2081042 RepID=UPI00255B388E|nr:CorA family divalent cation transporter [Polynucleobacter corsicus]